MREAILKAADQIAATPHLFDFHTVERPDLSCGTPGCALGWIGFFAGIKPEPTIVTATSEALGIDSMEFYERMDSCCDSEDWLDDPALCAAGLRAYADKYHPATR